jgi:hypothetical protein
MPFVAPWIWMLLEVKLELGLLVAVAFGAPKIVMLLKEKLEPWIPLEHELELKLKQLMLLEVKLEVLVLW